MKRNKLIPWVEFERKNFTKEQLKKIHKVAEKNIVLRRLKEARKIMGVSQYELSVRSGIPRSAISEIENGKRNVSVAKLSKLADALDTELEISFVRK